MLRFLWLVNGTRRPVWMDWACTALQHIISNSSTGCMKVWMDNCFPRGKISDGGVKVIFIHEEFSEKTGLNIDYRAFCEA